MEKRDLSRHGKSWSTEDETLLLKRLHEDVSFHDIALELKRSDGGVRSHTVQYAMRLVQREGKSLSEASEITTIPENEIEESIARRTELAAQKPSRPSPLQHPKPQVRSNARDDAMTVLVEIRDLLRTLVTLQRVNPTAQ